MPTDRLLFAGIAFPCRCRGLMACTEGPVLDAPPGAHVGWYIGGVGSSPRAINHHYIELLFIFFNFTKV